ncbi:type II toxin-antitoxin system prevent-host-death family antitoxin [uncultured Meiothermus sp.]|jgi:prevent-host-death family protein|uniref:type II toxin-antitoxin system prevent-host-death family antitoxin n=1 Tax=uncultured Meiothermus sp. TaxID=157471 RepID=UPI0026350522|nr:type II toxin-antitoxin system prevent-host-death family antitoxin [uncultured Meiothermus sp.]
MKTLDLRRDLVPVSEFRSNAAAFLKRLQEGDRLILTQNGKAAGVLMGVGEYQEMEIRVKELQSAVNSLIEARKGLLMDKDEAMQLIDREVERAHQNSSGR